MIAIKSRPSSATKHTSKLVEQIISELGHAETQTIPEITELMCALREADENELLSIHKTLSSGKDFIVQAREQIEGIIYRQRELLYKEIKEQLTDIGKNPDFEYTVSRIMEMDLDSGLAKILIQNLKSIENRLKSDEKSLALDYLLHEVLKASEGLFAAETYLQFSNDALKNLVEMIKESGTLDLIQDELDEFAEATEHGERQRLIRQMLVQLWAQYNLKEKAEKLVDVARKFEKILDLVVSRRHFEHQFETFLLGHIVLDELKKLLPENDRTRILGEEDEMEMTWLMTSSLHDIGYPLQQGTQIMEELCQMYQEMGTELLGGAFKTVAHEICSISELETITIREQGAERRSVNVPREMGYLIEQGTGSDPTAVEKMINKKWGERDHGLIAAALLWSAMVGANWVDPDVPSNGLSALRAASVAIALHSIGVGEMPFGIQLERQPYAFLLHAMDEIQEWSRTCEGHREMQPDYNLGEINSIDTDGKKVIDLIFTPSDGGKGAKWRLIGQVARKRNSLANLIPMEVPKETDELEVHAHFEVNSKETETVAVPLLLHGHS